ncbi:flagellar motor protein MotB [Aureimonas endophytica]|uniref:Flagellar motor protein MotB n=1 Tax=Aureimonas endophytica TaxID=2027858 RepID=A0A917EBC6_9HYPH|nr:MotB family protein [Aureimonas endophytica]GGE19852.1 flagellar motor protein MotB [Aureimonas endophytica]
MSATGAAGQPHSEIIIVKRHHGDDHGHHGGAWKIAFADFMTAMMAFFLVMWLTAVSDDATKKKIAQYFNPIQLNSMSPPNAGLADKPSETGGGSAKADGQSSPGKSEDNKPASGTSLGGQESALFRDPYAVLAEIAAEGGTGEKKGIEGVPNGSGLPGLNGGEAYRDPFDPTSWQLQPNAVAKAPDGTKQPPLALPNDPATAQLFPKTEVLPGAKPQDAAGAAAGAGTGAGAGTATASAAPATPPGNPAEAKAAELAKEIGKAAEAVSPGAAAGIEVKAGNGGVTISLADNIAGGMFQIGSAKPTAETLRLVESIGQILAEKSGSISIRGHTDARPYKGEEYDNWRLSTARAQFVFYMLARGGLDEKRVTGIEGVADRDPKVPNDPEAAANRRIEIILKEPAA